MNALTVNDLREEQSLTPRTALEIRGGQKWTYGEPRPWGRVLPWLVKPVLPNPPPIGLPGPTSPIPDPGPTFP